MAKRSTKRNSTSKVVVETKVNARGNEKETSNKRRKTSKVVEIVMATVRIGYLDEVEALKQTLPDWDTLYLNDSKVASIERYNQLVRLRVIGESLVDKYSWAIPDHQALKIIKYFAPIIELGAGNGYWSSLLRHQMSVDIIAYDREVDRSACHTEVLKGSPKVLKDAKYKDRTLMLCYPDEDSKLSLEALRFYDGEHIIHIGELMLTGTLSGAQCPFGRTTHEEFQLAVLETYHCVLVHQLPRYPFSRDCITVWKKSQWIEALPLENEDDDDHENDPEDAMWKSLPSDEILPMENIAAEKYKHLFC